MNCNQSSTPSLVNHMSNGLIELISLAELDAIMLTMLTPGIKSRTQVNCLGLTQQNGADSEYLKS